MTDDTSPVKEVADAPKTGETPYLFSIGTEFEGRIETAKDVDAIRFTVTEAGFHAISITGRDGGEDRPLIAAKAAVLDLLGESVARFDNYLRDPMQLTFNAKPGEYVIRLKGDFRYGSDAGDYMLSASKIEIDESDDAPADTSTPYSVSAAEPFVGQLDAEDRKDWIRAELVEGRVYGFDIERFGDWQHSNLFERLSVYNLKGNAAAITDLDLYSGQVVFEAQRTGTHFIEVAIDDLDDGDNGYRLVIYDYSLDETEDAPSSVATPYVIAPGEDFSGKLDNRDDVDTVSIDLEEGRVYRFSIKGEELPLDAELTRSLLSLRDPDGKLLASAGIGGGYNGSSRGKMDFFAETSGTYSLSVSTSRGKGLYEIATLELPSEGQSGEVPGDDTTGVMLAARSDFFGTLDHSGDQDWFKVSLTAATVSEFLARGSGRLRDTELTLYAADGSVLAYSGLSVDIAQFDYAPETDTEAFLALSAPGGLSSGDYQLSHKTSSFAGRVVGSADNDVYYADDSGVFIDGYLGDDLIVGGKGDDDLRGSSGDDRVEGGGGKDVLFGGRGDDILLGGAGRDKLYLNDGGNDIGRGGAGRDSIVLGYGSNEATGGAGRDRFLVQDETDSVVSGGSGADTFDFALRYYNSRDIALRITDYELGKDKIRLDDRSIVGDDLAAHVRALSHVDADGLTLDLKRGSTIMLDGVSDIEALISDMILV